MPGDLTLEVLRSLAKALKTKQLDPVQWSHVKDHQGVLGNEVAKLVLRTSIQAHKVDRIMPSVHLVHVPQLRCSGLPIGILTSTKICHEPTQASFRLHD